MLRFAVVTREGCDLCDELLAELQQFCAGRAAIVETLDVDADATLKRRFGHKVPVLLLDGEVVCHGRFDAAEVSRLAR
jgi:predicted thioredoxin/glutaredoxin